MSRRESCKKVVSSRRRDGHAEVEVHRTDDACRGANRAKKLSLHAAVTDTQRWTRRGFFLSTYRKDSGQALFINRSIDKGQTHTCEVGTPPKERTISFQKKFGLQKPACGSSTLDGWKDLPEGTDLPEEGPHPEDLKELFFLQWMRLRARRHARWRCGCMAAGPYSR